MGDQQNCQLILRPPWLGQKEVVGGGSMQAGRWGSRSRRWGVQEWEVGDPGVDEHIRHGLIIVHSF